MWWTWFGRNSRRKNPIVINDGAESGRVCQRSYIDRVVSMTLAVLVVAYPFLVYRNWQRVNPRLILGSALGLFGFRLGLAGFRVNRSQWKELALPWLLPAVFLSIAFVVGRRSLILYWPAIISATLLLAFGRTLLYPPPLVERFARIQKSELTEPEITYCRQVTRVWCFFFIINGSIALALARGSSLKAWTLYNGFVSYLLVGTLVFSEYVYRHW